MEETVSLTLIRALPPHLHHSPPAGGQRAGTCDLNHGEPAGDGARVEDGALGTTPNTGRSSADFA